MMANYDVVIKSKPYIRRKYLWTEYIQSYLLFNFIFHFLCFIPLCQCSLLVIHSLARLILLLLRMADMTVKRWCHPLAKLHYYYRIPYTLSHLSLPTCSTGRFSRADVSSLGNKSGGECTFILKSWEAEFSKSWDLGNVLWKGDI